MFTIEEIEHCVNIKYGETCLGPLAHAQAGALKSMDTHLC